MDRKIRFNNEPSKGTKVLREIVIIIVIVLAALAASFVLVHFGTEKLTVPGKSMQETLNEGDIVLVQKISYRLKNPGRGDIIAFTLPDSNAFSVKRIVGVPGDKIMISEGLLYVNGSPYEENARVDKMTSAGLAEQEITVGEGEYFVLGDNRNNSEDSRFASLGNISSEQIIGRVWLVLSPEFGFADKLNAPYEKEEKNG